MSAKSIFQNLIKKSPNWSQNKVAKELNMTSQDLSQRMGLKSDLRTDLFVSLLNVLGYDLVVVPKGSRLPQGSIKVEEDKEKGEKNDAVQKS